MINPNFDVAVSCSLSARSKDPNAWNDKYIDIYSTAFNCPRTSNGAFTKMMDKYDAAFKPWEDSLSQVFDICAES